MNLLSNSVVFLIMLFLGLFVVGINAATQFRTPVPNTNIGSFEKLLTGLPMHLLTMRRKYSFGFLIYLSTIELIYLLLSSSTVMLQAFMQFTGNTSSIGALAVNQSEINPYIPILASSVVITASQLTPFNVMEQFLRKTSHRFVSNAVAIERMASQIETADYSSIKLNEVDKNAVSVIEDKISSSCERAGWHKAQIERFSALRKDIRFLDTWTDGERSKIFKSLETIPEIAKLKALIDTRVDEFHDRLVRAVELDSNDAISWPSALVRTQKPLFSAEEFWISALIEAEETKRVLSVLLALYLSNLPHVVETIEDEHIRSVFLTSQQPTNSAGKYSTIPTGATLGAFICFIAFFAYHLTISAGLDVTSSFISAVSPSKVYVQSFSEIQMTTSDNGNDNDEDDVEQASSSSANVEIENDPEKEEKDRQDLAPAHFEIEIVKYFTRISSKSVSQAFWDAFIYSSMFLMACTVAVTACANDSPSSKWRQWSRVNFPFWQYAKVGVIASLLTFALYSLLLFFRLVVLPSLTLESTVLSVTLLADYKNHFIVGSGVPLMAFSVACCVCYIHDKLSINNHAPDKLQTSAMSDEQGKRVSGFWRSSSLDDMYTNGFYRCQVFSGFLEKHSRRGIDIGPIVMHFSIIAAVVNTLVMFDAGIVSSPIQFMNAFFLPAMAFFIIVSTYFELVTMNSALESEFVESRNTDQSTENEDIPRRTDDKIFENSEEYINGSTENA